MNLGRLDIAIMAVPLVIVLAVSLYLRRFVRSVADFLAANRCAGRFLISTAGSQTVASVMVMIVALEVFSQVGWSLTFWQSFTGIIAFFLGLLGVVSYRFRQTRALTFHQFFEVRYSRGVRMFASFLNAFSGILSFGVQPAVGARFFVYFCGFPEQLRWGGMNVPTYVPVMAILMAMSVYFALTGGQISVMVTDCLEGVISSIFYLIVAGFLVYTLSISQVRAAMLSGGHGASYVDPFDIGSRSDFDVWYVLIGLILNLYWFRGNAWNQGFAASAKTPHEGRMAGIVGNWRDYSSTAMAALVSIGAFTLLHSPAFASDRATVQHALAAVSLPQLRTQMQMPIAIGVLLAPGIKGCFCAVLLFGLLAGQGQQLHSYGSTFLQDVFLPMRKTPLQPDAHVRWLKLMVLGVAVFALLFSIWFKPVDYLVLAVQLLSTLYLGGIGFVVWGGLYWKKGTTAGAWTSIIAGSSLSVIFFIFQQYWPGLDPLLAGLFSSNSHFHQYLVTHSDKCPLNGLQLTLIAVIVSALGYVSVSLLTCKNDFNLDAMLHRGKYRVKADDIVADRSQTERSRLANFLNIDRHFTRGDKVLTYATFSWTIFWQIVAVAILLWTLVVGRLSPNWWFNYQLGTNVVLTLMVAVPTTIWFTIGVARDLWELVHTLRTSRRIAADDGTVEHGHNMDDPLIEDKEMQPG